MRANAENVPSAEKIHQTQQHEFLTYTQDGDINLMAEVQMQQ